MILRRLLELLPVYDLAFEALDVFQLRKEELRMCSRGDDEPVECFCSSGEIVLRMRWSCLDKPMMSMLVSGYFDNSPRELDVLV